MSSLISSEKKGYEEIRHAADKARVLLFVSNTKSLRFAGNVLLGKQMTGRQNDTRGGYATSQVRVFPDLKCTTLALLLYSHQ